MCHVSLSLNHPLSTHQALKTYCALSDEAPVALDSMCLFNDTGSAAKNLTFSFQVRSATYYVHPSLVDRQMPPV